MSETRLFRRRRSFDAMIAVFVMLGAGCARSQSEEHAAALTSAREAQARAEAELRAMKERAAAPVAVPPVPPAPEPSPPPTAATPTGTPTAPLPDVGRIKGDLIGQTVRGGILARYVFESLADIQSLKVTNRQVAGNVAEYTLDAVLRKDKVSAKRCFSTLLATYRRAVAEGIWDFAEVKANTFTCE